MVDIKTEGNEAVISVINTDRITVSNASELKSSMLDAINEKKLNVIIDLGSIRYIDSTAISVLISGVKASRINGSSFKLRNLQPEVMRLLSLMKIDQIMDIEK
ncbi:MAG: STAS domain-containing protein [Bacteroidales bacterium]|jgi:anti-sigma B factor antagonist|nr:STAS domain-containing protein [Bacteroidales bacterium]MBP5418582.1 STAS domain-containing protein [Bacteroidales bacterium]MCR5697067.1 STAS domain-containing protein [Marinilabiliaceae bacterium]